ncbi:hypothetical protein Ahy_Scaffold6g107849 isoform B [Arachis hypogaea]|uniref:Uncharacterized protein n=1 Tax=Arachis hypogaea TaxID=3818 RepID=A0A444WNR0_ARAHY|nr:hypothetical protein Ahy_Scaffold6g107849 isoform B [Arachis hypogaea]
MHYEMLVEDLKQIEEGHVPLPNYRNVPSKGYNYMEEERSPVRHSARLALSRRTLPRLAACTLDLPEQIAILGSLALGVVSEGANTMDVLDALLSGGGFCSSDHLDEFCARLHVHVQPALGGTFTDIAIYTYGLGVFGQGFFVENKVKTNKPN